VGVCRRHPRLGGAQGPLSLLARTLSCAGRYDRQQVHRQRHRPMRLTEPQGPPRLTGAGSVPAPVQVWPVRSSSFGGRPYSQGGGPRRPGPGHVQQAIAFGDRHGLHNTRVGSVQSAGAATAAQAAASQQQGGGLLLIGPARQMISASTFKGQAWFPRLPSSWRPASAGAWTRGWPDPRPARRRRGFGSGGDGSAPALAARHC